MGNPLKKVFNKKAAAVALATAAFAGLSAGCGGKPADVASHNLSNAADNFQINRQIDFINTIDGQNLLTIRGLCSLGNNDDPGELTVTCKTGEDKLGNPEFVKDFLGLSPTVTYVVQQLGSARVSTAHYSITFAPGTLVPNFNKAGGEQLTPPQSTAQTTTPSEAKTKSASVKVIPVPVPARTPAPDSTG